MILLEMWSSFFNVLKLAWESSILQLSIVEIPFFCISLVMLVVSLDMQFPSSASVKLLEMWSSFFNVLKLAWKSSILQLSVVEIPFFCIGLVILFVSLDGQQQLLSCLLDFPIVHIDVGIPRCFLISSELSSPELLSASIGMDVTDASPVLLAHSSNFITSSLFWALCFPPESIGKETCVLENTCFSSTSEDLASKLKEAEGFESCNISPCSGSTLNLAKEHISPELIEVSEVDTAITGAYRLSKP